MIVLPADGLTDSRIRHILELDLVTSAYNFVIEFVLYI
jgi:hypothetical protein